MSSQDSPIQTALGARIGEDAALALRTRAARFVNLPNTVRGMAKAEPEPEVEAACLAVVEDAALADALGLTPEGQAAPNPTGEFWALLTLAARADATVLDRLPEALTAEDYAGRLVAIIRRAAKKYATTAAAVQTSTGQTSTGQTSTGQTPQLQTLRPSASQEWDDVQGGPTRPPTTAQVDTLRRVVMELARRGVQVTAYRHERSWRAGLVEAAETSEDVVVAAEFGFITLAPADADLEQIRRRQRSNLV